MQGTIDGLQNENARLKTYLAASLAQLEQYKTALQKFVEENTKLEEELARKTEEIQGLKLDNAQLQ